MDWTESRTMGSVPENRLDAARAGISRTFARHFVLFRPPNRKILTYDEDLNLLHSCDITYPDEQTFWHHEMYQDRFSGRFYTIFGTKLNEIDVKTGKTIPKTNANNYLSPKMIIYKGNLYTLKRKRDSSNSEISYIEKTNLY